MNYLRKNHALLLLLIVSGSIASFSFQHNLVSLNSLSSEFEYEIRYATSNNFIGEVLYECPKCLLRPEVASALLRASQYFCDRGFRVKFYDCYRPLDVQKKMWKKVPRATYVANPYGKGSIHNKGAAVDVTLVTLEGDYVDMGSDFDHFGREAHIDNLELSEKIKENRNILFEGMRLNGFNTIRTEWWHFNYRKNLSYNTLNIPFNCSN